MEDYVTFEQAKKLKELGFDWKCTHYYDDNGTLTPSFEEVSADGGYEYTISINNLAGNFNLQNGEDDEWCSAPNLTQAQKWLREVKRIHVWVEPEISEYDNDIVYLIYVWDNNKRQYPENYDGVKDKDTYEQAFSAGIDKALELLK